MARLLGPDPVSRFAIYFTSDRRVEGLPGKTLTVYTDEACTILAGIGVYDPAEPTVPGAAIAGSKVKIGQDSKVPLFWLPDGLDLVWGKTVEGAKLPLRADTDSRLDVLGRGGPVPTGPAVLARRLDHAAMPCSMLLLGDSTGNSTTEWFYGLADWLADQYPALRVRYQLWSDGAQAYGIPAWLGTGSGVRRQITVPAAAGINLTTPNSTALQITGDLDVRATVTLDTMPPGQNVDVCGKTASAPNRSWWMSITSTGNLQLSWSNDGTTTLSQTSSAVIPAGAKTLRAALDVDNGASQYTVIFYTSTDWDGAAGTWTQLGSTRTGATGVTSIFAGTAATQLISRSGGTWPVAGTATALQVLSAGVVVVDLDMGGLADAATTLTDYAGNVWTVIGSPARAGDLTFAVFNGSVVSETVAYANDAGRFPKLTPYPADVVFISYGHNESGLTYAGYTTLTNALAAKWSTTSIVPVLQNPQTLNGRTAAQIHAHTVRMDLVAGLAAANKWPVVDAFQAFVDDERELDELITDGVHPGDPGSAVWLDTAKRLFTPWL
jgi:hypothetical protein